MPQPKLAPNPFSAVCDELGQLEKEYAILIAPFRMKAPRMEALRKQLRAACPAKPDQEWRVQGERFEVMLGPKAQWRVVDLPKLIKLIGAKAFAKIATVTLTALEAECPSDVVSDVVTKEHTGPRTITTYEKGSA